MTILSFRICWSVVFLLRISMYLCIWGAILKKNYPLPISKNLVSVEEALRMKIRSQTLSWIFNHRGCYFTICSTNWSWLMSVFWYILEDFFLHILGNVEWEVFWEIGAAFGFLTIKKFLQVSLMLENIPRPLRALFLLFIFKQVLLTQCLSFVLELATWSSRVATGTLVLQPVYRLPTSQSSHW